MNDDKSSARVPASKVPLPLKNLRNCFTEILSHVRPHSKEDESFANFEEHVIELQKSMEEVYSSLPTKAANQFAVEMLGFLKPYLPGVASKSREFIEDKRLSKQTFLNKMFDSV